MPKPSSQFDVLSRTEEVSEEFKTFLRSSRVLQTVRTLAKKYGLTDLRRVSQLKQSLSLYLLGFFSAKEFVAEMRAILPGSSQASEFIKNTLTELFEPVKETLKKHGVKLEDLPQALLAPSGEPPKPQFSAPLPPVTPFAPVPTARVPEPPRPVAPSATGPRDQSVFSMPQLEKFGVPQKATAPPPRVTLAPTPPAPPPPSPPKPSSVEIRTAEPSTSVPIIPIKEIRYELPKNQGGTILKEIKPFDTSREKSIEDMRESKIEVRDTVTGAPAIKEEWGVVGESPQSASGPKVPVPEQTPNLPPPGKEVIDLSSLQVVRMNPPASLANKDVAGKKEDPHAKGNTLDLR